MELEDFVKHYIEAAFFSSTDDDGQPLDSNYDDDDISSELLEKMTEDCRLFREMIAPLIAEENPADDQIARDFWYTRNGHGVGFWESDRGYSKELGRKLTDICQKKPFGECNIYVGDDGLLYC